MKPHDEQWSFIKTRYTFLIALNCHKYHHDIIYKKIPYAILSQMLYIYQEKRLLLLTRHQSL